MLQVHPLPPETRRAFASPWSELDYLCKKIHYWLHMRGRRKKASRFLPRLKRVLGEIPSNSPAILRQEGMALLSELRGNVRLAADYRNREIELMERLHREAKSPRVDAATREYMLRDRGDAVLAGRRAILKTLLREMRSKSSLNGS